MKCQNDTGDPDRNGEDPGGGAPAAPTSATGMFQQPLAPPGHPEFNNPGAEFRAPSSGETGERPVLGSRMSLGGNALGPLAQVQPPSADVSPAAGEKKSSSGEFTRLFQAVTPSTKIPEPPQTPYPISTAPDPRTGEFTRIFMRLPKDSTPEPQSALPVRPGSSQPTGNLQASETGEFTRLMRASEPTAEPTRPEGAPAVAPSVSSSAPLRGFSAPGENDAVSGIAGMTELFVATTPQPSASAAPSSSRPIAKATPSHQLGSASHPTASGFQGSCLPRQEQSAGEFTQLFRALDSVGEPSPSTVRMGIPSPAAATKVPQSEKAPAAGGGEFTQLLQSLSHEQSHGITAGRSAQTRTALGEGSAGILPEPMPTSSEVQADEFASFTRVISNSLAREEATTGMKPTADAQAADASHPKERASVPPLAPVPGVSKLPQASIPRPASFGQPPVAPVPTPAMSHSSAQGLVWQSKLQAYMPLLLVVNAFALAVLILLVIFALRRH